MAMSNKQIKFEQMPGFTGEEEFRPAGWRMETKDLGGGPKKQSNTATDPAGYPMGAGMAMVNGCFLTGYQPGDKCYQFKVRFSINKMHSFL